MLFLFVECDVLSEIDNRVVDPGTDIPGPAHVQQFFPVLAFSPAYNWGQDLELDALWQQGNGIDHLLHRLRRNFFPALITVRPANPCE